MTSRRYTPTDRWRAVIEADSIRGPARAVLNALAYHTHQKTLEAWPSITTLARESGLSVATVRRSTRSLELCGAVTVLLQSDGGSKHPNRYRVNLDETWLAARVKAREPSQSATVEPLQAATVATCGLNPCRLRLELLQAATRTEVLNRSKDRSLIITMIKFDHVIKIDRMISF